MTAQAQKDGAIPVVIHMAAVDMTQLSTDLRGVKAAMAQHAARLLAELGPHAWDAGRWEYGLGQMGVHVTPAGLKILQNSGNAISFTADQPWRMRSKLGGFDGSLEAIDRALDSKGYVDAIVTLNVDGLAFDTLKDGSVSLRPTTKTTGEGRVKGKTLLESLSTAEAPGKSSATAALGAMATPALPLRLTRQGVVRLAASDLVRSLKPVGFIDARPVNFDADIMEMAQQAGRAEVIVGIRTPLMGGNPSAASVAEQTQSHQRALASLFQDTGVRSKLQDLSTMGAMAGMLTLAELQSLKATKDARLFSVELNRPMASPSLSISAATMNMPAAWSNPNFRGAGQTIVVMDTGVQSNHEFFKDAAGNSRVYFEGCFGTHGVPGNSLPGTLPWKSNCPFQDLLNPLPALPTYDSPFPLVNSASPFENCKSSVFCEHGTKVAGIAAGRASPLLPSNNPPALFQGVAPDARIMALQVFSWSEYGVPPTVFKKDVYTVLEKLIAMTMAGTVGNPYVINMSFGSIQTFLSECTSYSPLIQPLVQTLFDRGVPIIAATGNGYSRVAIS